MRTPAPPLPHPLWNHTSPELQAAILALVPIHQQRLAALETRLQLNFTTPSRPPSSDPIGLKRKAYRPLVPTE